MSQFFNEAWRLLKAIPSGQSFRGDIMQHLPTELNYDALQSHLEQNPNSTLGDLMTPYLTGEFTKPTSEVSTNPRSYQDENLPFPLNENEATSFVGNFSNQEGGYTVPQSYYQNNRSNEDIQNQKTLSNMMRVLHGRLRHGQTGFEMSPPRTGGKGVKLPSGKMARHNMRLQDYMNTPISVRQAEMTPLAQNQQMITTGEPMNLGVGVIRKERKSPEAKRHKLEYDKQYEASPERVKYREELNRERRKRGMYGDHSHRDISHTEGGKLTVEDEHDNRARHFKDKGTKRPLTKGIRGDLELLRNLMNGPMDEQDKKIAQALITSLDDFKQEQGGEERKELMHPYPF
jgi:hypothetical protein